MPDPLTLHPAIRDGQCDHCGYPFEAGDLVAQPTEDEAMCDYCVLDHRALGAAA